jgi:hypothetical protein
MLEKREGRVMLQRTDDGVRIEISKGAGLTVKALGPFIRICRITEDSNCPANSSFGSFPPPKELHPIC